MRGGGGDDRRETRRRGGEEVGADAGEGGREVARAERVCFGDYRLERPLAGGSGGVGGAGGVGGVAEIKQEYSYR